MAAVLCRAFSLQQFDVAMDIVHDTFETALLRWKFSGVPDNPSGWLMQVAKNKVINYLKRQRKTEYIGEYSNSIQVDQIIEPYFNEVEDSQLRLLLSCCRLALPQRTIIILTLNILCGFGRQEIANALLMREGSVKKALTRARAKLRSNKHLLENVQLLNNTDNISTAHVVLYLMFNEGYKNTRGSSLVDNEMCYEAVRLTKLLLNEDGDVKPETNALLALMFFSIARFPSRVTSRGEIVTLASQDRSHWDRRFIHEGYQYLEHATKGDSLSRYHIEAIISSLHCAAPVFEQTDWEKIVYLYEQLVKISPSPFVTLNKIIAQSYHKGPEMGLVELEHFKCQDMVEGHYLIYAAAGDMYYRLGKKNLAGHAFNQALILVNNNLEKEFIIGRLRDCGELTHT